MDLTNRLQESFSKLGYFGTIPIPLQRHPSTSFIWEQFIRNVKPKNDVDVCRKNIIINRLQRKLSIEDTDDYPIQEIQVYNELKAVRKNIEMIKKRIQEKQNKEAFLREANKSNYLQINSLKEHIEEKKIKLHALKLKATDTRNRLKLIDTTTTKGIALVSDDNSLSSENVTNTLKTLVETIEKLSPIHKFPNSNRGKYITSSYNISRIQSPRKKCYSTLKKNKANVPRIQRFGSCVNMSAVKSLFKDSLRENDFNFENIMKEDRNDSKLLDQSPKLLPDSCFDFKADDEFLMSFRSTDDILSEKEYVNPLKKESILDNSMKCQFTSEMRPRRDYFENAYTDDHLIQKIDEVLYGASVRVIWTSICNLREDLLRKSRFELESSKANVRFKIDATGENDISRLNFIYVKNNLLALKSKQKIKHLIHAIKEKKSDIEVQLGGHTSENRLEGLELMLESVKLKAAIEYMHKEINIDKSDCIITLNSLNNKIDKVKEELFAKMKEVEGFMESKEYLMQQLKKCQNDTALCVRRLNQFISDTVWIEGLIENVHSKEINAFRDFPLDYNKKFCFTDNSFYMDSMRKIILDEDTPNDTLFMIHSIIEHPQYPPEKIFIESLKKKQKFQVMSSLRFSKVKLEQKNYSLQEFQEQEKYVDKICENLMSNIRSWKAYQVLNSSSRMKSNMELWLDMPFKRFVSKERKVDGKSYKDYEEKYEYLRNSK